MTERTKLENAGKDGTIKGECNADGMGHRA